MIHIVFFSIIALSIFIITFLKLIKENNSNYIFILISEFIGLIIDFIFIFLGKSPKFITYIFMYIFNIFIPILGFILEKNKINLFELLGIFKAKIYKNKDKSLTKEILLKNVQKHPNSYISHKTLAQWYEENSEKEKAEYEYLKAIELKPKNFENYLKLANIYKENDKSELCINLLQDLLKRKPEYTEASLLLGEALYNNNLFKEAITVYKEALKYSPGKYELYYAMGMTYTRLNDFQNAKDYYKKAATLNSMLEVAKLNLGQISLIFKEYDEAEKYFMQCIETEDEKLQAEAYYYLAKIKLINGQKELAIQYTNIALELNPDIIKIVENDIDFLPIMGKIKKQVPKRTNTKINNKENEIIEYLNNTYSVVEKLIQNDDKKIMRERNIERDI